ncbi:MAG: hypothetical protein WCE62_15180 [Polyangiales bacterium]
MLRASGILAIALLVIPQVAVADNNDQVVAGTDVALTGGAVVANVHTGGALWYNPAGVARLDGQSVTLSGALIEYSIVHAPGALSIEGGEQSGGEYTSLHVVPRAFVYVAAPQPNLRWGIGLFYSRSLNRFIQDSVSTASGSSEPAQFFASANERTFVYHLSSAVAWKHSKKLLVGGAFDLVMASQRVSEGVSGAYAQGQGGALSLDVNQSISGGGLQIKAGVQWAPINAVRIGWMVAMPSYLAFLSERSTSTQTWAPPTGSPQFTGNQIDQVNAAWAGVEPGLTRLGVAYLGSWGWVESDLVVAFPLHTSQLDIDLNATADVQVGGVFRVTDHLKLGCGFFTDFSAEPTPSRFAETDVDFYGFTVGADFVNREQTEENSQDGFYLALAIAFRYAHGTGTMGGVTFPAAYPAPPAQPAELNLVDIKVDELSVNLAFKAAF